MSVNVHEERMARLLMHCEVERLPSHLLPIFHTKESVRRFLPVRFNSQGEETIEKAYARFRKREVLIVVVDESQSPIEWTHLNLEPTVIDLWQFDDMDRKNRITVAVPAALIIRSLRNVLLESTGLIVNEETLSQYIKKELQREGQ